MTQESMLARYKILHELGRGATGAVYAARDRETGAVVALKRLDPGLLGKSDANVAERFLKHARSARLLKHRNIAEIHEAGEVAGTVYVAMEMLEGESLRRILDAGPLPIARAIQIARDIACGLAYAHLEGVVHGGLKPSNVIVLRSGVVKITDFGTGQLAQAAALSRAPAGCLSYMSPEQMRGDPVDHRCDIFSLGALFYEMLTRRPPFEGKSPKEIEGSVRAEPPRPSEVNPHVPRALDGIVLGMLAAQPAARMPGAPVLLRELERIEEGLGLGSGAGATTDAPAASVSPAEPAPRMPDPNRPRELPDASNDREAFDYHEAMLMMDRESRRERSSGSRPAIFAAFLLVLGVLGIGGAGFMYYTSVPGERGIAASRIQDPPETAPAPIPTPRPALAEATEEPATAPAAPQASPPTPLAAQPSPLAQTHSSVAPASEQPAAAGAATQAHELPQAQELPRTQELPQAMPAKANVRERAGGTARLILAISPRGEIYIDGEHHGTTPPITTFDLDPGMHRIEVRSGSRTPYLTYMTVQAGDVRRIRYDFNADGAVHPPRTASWHSSNRPVR